MAPRAKLAACLVAACAAGAAPARAADAYDALSDSLLAAVERSSVTRAEFLPLVGADERITPQGRMLTAKLLARLSEHRRVEFVMGTLPEAVMEPYLAALDENEGKELRSRLKPALPPRTGAVVMGTYLVVRDRVRANIQVVDVPTGRILFAGELDAHNDWETPPDLWREAPPRRVRAPILPEAAARAPVQAEDILADLVRPKAPETVTTAHVTVPEISK